MGEAPHLASHRASRQSDPGLGPHLDDSTLPHWAKRWNLKYVGIHGRGVFRLDIAGGTQHVTRGSAYFRTTFPLSEKWKSSEKCNISTSQLYIDMNIEFHIEITLEVTKLLYKCSLRFSKSMNTRGREGPSSSDIEVLGAIVRRYPSGTSRLYTHISIHTVRKNNRQPCHSELTQEYIFRCSMHSNLTLYQQIVWILMRHKVNHYVEGDPIKHKHGYSKNHVWFHGKSVTPSYARLFLGFARIIWASWIIQN